APRIDTPNADTPTPPLHAALPICTGRAHPAMFNKITAEYYGTQTPINQLASFSVPEPRMAVVTPFDKSALRNIEQAIRDSDLGRSEEHTSELQSRENRVCRLLLEK